MERRAGFHRPLRLALMLTIGVCQPTAAQTASRRFADLGRYLQIDAIALTDRESGQTPWQTRASSTASGSTPIDASTAQVPSALDSQRPVVPLSTLSSRVKPGDTVSVRLTSGEDIVGTFLRASASSVAMLVDGQSREISANDVRQVVSGRGGNRLRRGLLIGAPLGALLGSGPCYRVDTPVSGPRPSCGAWVSGGAAVGTGIGALIGSRTRRPMLVYSAPPGPPTTQVHAAVESPTSVSARAPASSLGTLSSRVTPFDMIYVRKMDGEEIVGTFSRVSESSLTILIRGQAQEIPTSEVQQVRRRGENRAKQGVLYGYLTGTAVGLIALTPSASDKGSAVFVSFTAAGGVGLLYGALIGAFVHERPVVYRAGGPTVRVIPVLAPDRAVVMALVHF